MMKKTWMLSGLLAVALVAVPGVSGAVQITLDEGTCTVLSNPSMTDGYDDLGVLLVGTLTTLGVDLGADIGTTWDTWDVELVWVGPGPDDYIVGDGVLDNWQMALLAAIQCTSQTDAMIAQILSQIPTNLQAYDDFVTEVVVVVNMLGDVTTQLGTIVTGLQAIPGIQGTDLGGGYLVSDLVTELDDFEQDLAEIAPFAPMIGGLLPQFGSWFGGMAGLSTEMQGQLNDILGEIEGLFTEIQTMETYLNALLAAHGTAGDGQLDGATETAVNDLIANIQSIVITLPLSFVTFGATKAANEPLSAFGDYNGDGTTNLEDYNTVQAGGGTRADWVALVTAPPAAGTPVTGLIGLGLMASAMAAGGAFVIRRKK